MNIPSRVNPFGYDNSVPPGYARLEFLESTRAGQVIILPISLNSESRVRLKFKRKATMSIVAVQCVDDNYVYAVWPSTYSGSYMGVQYGTRTANYENLAPTTRADHRLFEIDVTPPTWTISTTEEDSTLNNPTGTRTLINPSGWTIDSQETWLFRPKTGGYSYEFRLYCAALNNGEKQMNLIPALDETGIPCMFDTVTGQPFRNQGTGQFIAGFDMAQAEDLGSTIPGNTTLTVSFPWEASLVLYNSRVEYSLEQARDKGCTISVQYREPEKDSAIYNKYAECETVNDIFAVNPTRYGFRDDVTIDGTWMYPLPNLVSVSSTYNGSLFGILDYNTEAYVGTKVKKLILSLPKCTSCGGLVQWNGLLEYLDIDLPVCTNIQFLARQSKNIIYCRVNAPAATRILTIVSYANKLKEVEVNTPKVLNTQEFFYRCRALETVVCPEGNFDNVTAAQNMYCECKALKDFPLSYPSLKIADAMFDGCLITGGQAIAILDSIPTWTDGASHPITIGIHIAHQNDEEVVAAITAAEEKGWTVTVQWNGTPTAQTASTFGLRKPPIYAKIDTMEHPDGTTENFLGWGHYVTNWEENGYQEFASKEEAYEHFNLEMETEE